MTINVSRFQSVSYILFQYKKSWAHILVTQQNINLIAVPENPFLWEWEWTHSWIIWNKQDNYIEL